MHDMILVPGTEKLTKHCKPGNKNSWTGNIAKW